MASRCAPTRPTYSYRTDPLPLPRTRPCRFPGVTLVLVPAGQRTNAVARPAVDAWILVLAGSGTAGPRHRHRFLRPGTLLRLPPDAGPVTAAAAGLAYLSLTTG